MKNAFHNGLIAGGLATLGSTALELLGSIPLPISTTIHMIAKLIFPNQNLNLLKLFYGLIIHITAGCLIGIFIALLFRYLSYEFPYIIAIMAGIFFWIIHTLLIPNLAAKNVILFRSELEVTIDLISHLIYGFITILYLKSRLNSAIQ